jgi:hypothetical protein
MPRVRLDIATAVLAVSGVVGALALVGIFIVYLTDDRGSPASNAPATTAAPATTGVTTQQGKPATKAPATQGPTGKAAAGNAAAGNAAAGNAAAGNAAAGNAAGAKTPAAPNAKIPANQVFVSYRNRPGGYSFRYPKGWAAQSAPRKDAAFGFAGDAVRVFLNSGRPATPTGVLKQLNVGLDGNGHAGPARRVVLNGASVIRLHYTRSVGGGKFLIILRFVFSKGGKQAIMDLTSAPGVTNVPAYQKMARSFRWL